MEFDPTKKSVLDDSTSIIIISFPASDSVHIQQCTICMFSRVVNRCYSNHWILWGQACSNFCLLRFIQSRQRRVFECSSFKIFTIYFLSFFFILRKCIELSNVLLYLTKDQMKQNLYEINSTQNIWGLGAIYCETTKIAPVNNITWATFSSDCEIIEW